MNFFIRNQNKIEKIAFFRALMIGDLLCSVPSFRSLRKAFPRARITLIGLDWAKWFTQRYSMYIDDFIEFPGYFGLPEKDPVPEKLDDFLNNCKQRQFDLALQMHGDGTIVNKLIGQIGAKFTAGFFIKNGFAPQPENFMEWPDKGHEIHKMLKLLHFLGIALDGDTLEFPLSCKEEYSFKKFKNAYGLEEKNFICIHPGARLATRRWETAKFSELAKKLHGQGFSVVLTGAKEETELIKNGFAGINDKIISLAGKIDLTEMAILLKNSRLLITNDTGISHLAAAVGAESIVIITGSDPERWAPLDKTLHTEIAVPVPCRPCFYYKCPFDMRCSKGISVDDVLNLCSNRLRSIDAAV